MKYIVFLCLLFFVAIAFDITPYLRGPEEWRWPYQFINTISKVWFPGLVLVGILGLFKIAESGKLGKWGILGGLVILSFLWELSVIYFSRAGIGVLLRRIIDPGMNGYYTAGLNIHDLRGFITDYPRIVLDLPMHAKGHPPGMPILFYFLNSIIPISDKFLAFGVGIFFALLNSLAVIPLWFATKNWRAVFFYITIPSLALFLPLPDGFFAFFGITAVSLILLKKPFLAGLVFAVGLFFSYSLLPLLLFILFLKPKIRFYIPIIIYFLVFWQTFLTVVGGQAGRDYLTWVFYDLWDFVVYAGLPLITLYILSSRAKGEAIFLLITIFLLTLSGASRAETGRIWVPLMAMIPLVINYKKFATSSVMILLGLQMVQTLVIQEFWVPLW